MVKEKDIKETERKERIKKNGNSLCVILDKRVLNKVYNLDDGSEIKVTYQFPQIVIEGAAV